MGKAQVGPRLTVIFHIFAPFSPWPGKHIMLFPCLNGYNFKNDLCSRVKDIHAARLYSQKWAEGASPSPLRNYLQSRSNIQNEIIVNSFYITNKWLNWPSFLAGAHTMRHNFGETNIKWQTCSNFWSYGGFKSQRCSVIIIIIIIICSFCNARHINPLGSQGAAVWQPQRTHR